MIPKMKQIPEWKGGSKSANERADDPFNQSQTQTSSAWTACMLTLFCTAWRGGYFLFWLQTLLWPSKWDGVIKLVWTGKTQLRRLSWCKICKKKMDDHNVLLLLQFITTGQKNWPFLSFSENCAAKGKKRSEKKTKERKRLISL